MKSSLSSLSPSEGKKTGKESMGERKGYKVGLAAKTAILWLTLGGKKKRGVSD